MSSHSQTHEIRTILEQKREQFKDELQSYIRQMHEWVNTEDTLFYNDILFQFLDVATFHICSYLTQSMACSYEDAIIEVEELNLVDYLDLKV